MKFLWGDLDKIIKDAFTFSPVLHSLDDKAYCLELYHGPTLSFKDFGAQFMSHLMHYFSKNNSETTTILVATSGDTGSAVANAYHNLDGFRVVLLYPSGNVSPLQEKQLTTIGGNVTALEVEGTFDDCQALVKTAFNDQDLNAQMKTSSANSINLGRLFPQSFYYFWSVLQIWKQHKQDVTVIVPSGNFGNLTAGIFADQMGLYVDKFIAAVNSNDIVPTYLKSGEFKPRPSVTTLSNAMDVGNPSNWERIRTLFGDDYLKIKAYLWAQSVTDDLTIQSIQDIYNQYKYIIDPHTAVGFKVSKTYFQQNKDKADSPYVVLSTAHPGKFPEIVSKALGTEIQLPDALVKIQLQEKQSIKMRADYDAFKQFLYTQK